MSIEEKIEIDTRKEKRSFAALTKSSCASADAFIAAKGTPESKVKKVWTFSVLFGHKSCDASVRTSNEFSITIEVVC